MIHICVYTTASSRLIKKAREWEYDDEEEYEIYTKHQLFSNRLQFPKILKWEEKYMVVNQLLSEKTNKSNYSSDYYCYDFSLTSKICNILNEGLDSPLFFCLKEICSSNWEGEFPFKLNITNLIEEGTPITSLGIQDIIMDEEKNVHWDYD